MKAALNLVIIAAVILVLAVILAFMTEGIWYIIVCDVVLFICVLVTGGRAFQLLRAVDQESR